MGQAGCADTLDLNGVERLASIELHRPVRLDDSASPVRLRCADGGLELIVDDDVRPIPTEDTAPAVLSRIVALAIVESLRAREHPSPPNDAPESSPEPEEGHQPERGAEDDAQAEQASASESAPPEEPQPAHPWTVALVPAGSLRVFLGSGALLGGAALQLHLRRARLVLVSELAFHRNRASASLGEVRTTLLGASFAAGVATSLEPVETSLEVGLAVDAAQMAGRAEDPANTRSQSGWNALVALRLQGSLRWALARHALVALSLGVEWALRPVAAGVGSASELELGPIGVFARAGFGWRR